MTRLCIVDVRLDERPAEIGGNRLGESLPGVWSSAISTDDQVEARTVPSSR